VGVTDIFAGSGEASAFIVRHDVDDQHDDGSLQLSHSDDHGPNGPRQHGWDGWKDED